MKYNLIRTICVSRSDSNKEILFFDLCKFNMNELIGAEVVIELKIEIKKI